jgi:hypothetical protein
VLVLEGTHAMPHHPDKDGMSKYVRVMTGKSFK